jgi:hypothetical protein
MLKKFIANGGKSKADLSSENFDSSLLLPIKSTSKSKKSKAKFSFKKNKNKK